MPELHELHKPLDSAGLVAIEFDVKFLLVRSCNPASWVLIRLVLRPVGADKTCWHAEMTHDWEPKLCIFSHEFALTFLGPPFFFFFFFFFLKIFFFFFFFFFA